MSKKQKTKKTNSAKKKNDQADELEVIAKRMDEISRRRLPDGIIRCGALKGMEPEIRQEALIISVGGYLQKNTDYIDARQKNDDTAIQRSMEKCMAITLCNVKKRIASQLTHERARTKELTEENGGTGQHPSQTKPCELSPDMKTVMIMRSVAKAVYQGKLSIANASIVSLICERGMAAEEVAQTVGITKSAVYQQVWRVRSVLPEIMEQVETPLL